MEHFPSQVTLFEDGVYRWSYDLDMWHNRYLLRVIGKIISALFLIPAALILVMTLINAAPVMEQFQAGNWRAVKLQIGNDLQLLAFVLGIWLFMMVLMFVIYAICALVMKGTYHLCFQMDETAVELVRSARARAVMDISALLSPNPALAAGDTAITRFDSVRRVKIVPQCDVLDLRVWFGMNQIFVNAEDFDLVRTFILARIPEKARLRSWG